jgi:hypothetical protein
MTDSGELSRLADALVAEDINYSFRYHSWVSRQHRYICMTVPKVACTTVKMALHHLEGHTRNGDLEDIHNGKKGSRLKEFSIPEIVEMLVAPDWCRFCFVRNPYYRLLSAYKSKIGNTWNREFVFLQDKIRDHFGYPSRNGRRGMVTFHDFVLYLSEKPKPAWRDGHYNSQSNILSQNLISYDFIGRFTNFEDDFKEVLSRFDADTETIEVAREVRNTTAETHASWAFDGELADLAYELYREDFEAFEYEKDSWMFPEK